MNLGEMLNELSANILRDTNEPRLWSDEHLTDLLNQGVEAFCLALRAPESRSSYTLVAGQDTVQLNKSLLDILSVKAGELQLRRVRHLKDLFRSKAVLEYYVDTVSGKLHFNAAPTSDVVIEVYGIPAPQPMVYPSDEPDGVDPAWHRALLYFAAWHAFDESDIEGYSAGMSVTYYNKWRIELARARNAVYKLREGRAPIARSDARFN